jgi:hypothetical protein
MKLSFKKEKAETGLRAIASPDPTTQIKADKVRCGSITPPNRFSGQGDLWYIQMMVKREPTEQDPCDFRWVTLKGKFKTEPECRDWIKANWEAIQKLGLYRMDFGD